MKLKSYGLKISMKKYGLKFHETVIYSFIFREMGASSSENL